MKSLTDGFLTFFISERYKATKPESLRDGKKVCYDVLFIAPSSDGEYIFQGLCHVRSY